ncbi:MAG: VCBS repeat-containing protein [Saprospiraceae bacterium]|nr:VCBS repeat-containing protein [Saprospiraceae bacterium]
MRSLLFACALLFIACSPDPRFKPGKAAKPVLTPTTTFELLTPERTGIDFIPSIQEEFRYNFMADPYIYNGGGVAIIDVNNDGLQDLFFTARLQGCRLYLNKGGLKFEDISERSGVSKFSGLKTGVTVVDINADGWQDLYVCRTWLSPLPDRRNLLFVNLQNNTFSERAAEFDLDDLSASQHANFFDYDLDGDLDCYILNHPVDFKNMNNIDQFAGPARSQAPKDAFESDRLLKNEGPVSLLMGGRKGGFIEVTQQAGLKNRAFGLSTIASDFNDDGWPDLFVGNDFVMPDFLYLNNGDGSFSDKGDTYFRHTSNHTMGADFADLNRDGLADLITLDMLAAEGPRRQRLMSSMSLERDRQMQQRGYGRQAMRNALQIADGNSGFFEIGHLAGMAATDWSWAPLLADFDNDGWRDLFVSSGVKRDLNDLDFFLYTADSINRTGGVSKGRFPNFEDYVGLMPSMPSHNYLFQNTGSLQLSDVSEAWGFGKSGFSNGAAYADLDNDGDIDLITNNLEAPPGIYENKATSFNQNHWLQIKCKGTAQNPVGIGAKVRVWAGGEMVFSQEMTPVRGFYSSVEAIFQVGLGALKSVDKVEIDWQERRFQILNNIPVNQRIVLNIEDARPGRCPVEPRITNLFFEEITATSGLDFEHRENPFEDFDREKLLPYRLSRTGPRIATGDLNGDGLEDVFIGGASGQAGAVFLQDSEGNFSKVPQPAFESDKDFEDTANAFFDAEGDGDLDLYVVSGGNEQPANASLYQDRLYLNDGKGNFTRAAKALPAETQSGSCVAVFDYDGDGQKDLFVGGRAVPGRFPVTAESFVFKNESGVFKNVTASVAPEFQKIGMVTDIQFGDLDGDGKAEMVVAGDWMALTVFKLKGQAVTLSQRLTNASGLWRCLSLSDLDEDGDLDIAAGNWGLNSRHHASKIAPLRLFANDFDHNGSLDPLLCTPWEGAYYPVVQRDQLASQIPAVKKKFPKHTPYSNATVTDIFSANKLLGGISLEAKTLETQWFENQNGRFIAHKLPLEAQFAPVNRILAADFNGDGKTDLLTVGNDFGPDAETYRQDASNGCLFVGDGKGGFKWVPNLESGFWASEASRDAVLVRQQSGKNVLILGNNHGKTRAFWVKSSQ